MRRYIVIGPEYSEYTSWGEPPEYSHDVYLVEADTAHEAKWLAWMRAKENRDPWFNWVEGHPLSGVRAVIADDRERPGAWSDKYVVLREIAK